MDNKWKSKDINPEENNRGEKKKLPDPDARSERLIIDEDGKPHSYLNHESGDSGTADKNKSGSREE